MYILKCEAFDSESSVRHNNRCCVGDCHVENRLIPVTPYAIDATLENRRLDWEMGIQAQVCCGRYEFVRSLSREWWANKGQSCGLWSREQVDKLMHKGSWHSTLERSPGRSGSGYSGTVGVSAAKSRKGSNKCPGCSSTWNGEVCDNCGYGFSL
jgi:hypothetical protein